MVHGVGQGLAIGDGQAAITRLRLTRRQPGLAVWSGDQRPALDDSSEPAPPGGKS
jgi:PBP1b-binding outer membrane lipoprotein LpoB